MSARELVVAGQQQPIEWLIQPMIPLSDQDSRVPQEEMDCSLLQLRLPFQVYLLFMSVG